MAVIPASPPPGGEGQNRPAPDCVTDPAASLKDMFVDLTQGDRIAGGQSPVERPVFLKPHGTAHGRLTVAADLPRELRVGL